MFNLIKKVQDESIEDQIKEADSYPVEFSKSILQGLDCDSLPNSQGEFGRSYTNPIPVNGPLGEIKYLNKLRTGNGMGLIFHRLGSVEASGIEGNVDIFETVSVDGKVWDILYLHMYHPRRSLLLPDRYKRANFDNVLSKLPLGFGSTTTDNKFPHGIGDKLRKKGSLGVKFAEKYENTILKENNFVRPDDHMSDLDSIMGELHNR